MPSDAKPEPLKVGSGWMIGGTARRAHLWIACECRPAGCPIKYPRCHSVEIATYSLRPASRNVPRCKRCAAKKGKR